MSHDTVPNSKKLINEARKEILIKKNPAKAIESLMLLAQQNDLATDNGFLNSLALAYFENKNYTEAAKIYQKLNEKYQIGFCELLLGNEDKARELWFNAANSAAIHWGRCLIDLIHTKVGKIPTFLQIRNYLESDISYFIEADKVNYAENLINCEEFLFEINPESYKFIGRALLNSGFNNLAIKYFLKSQEIIPNDPEIYYHIGQYCYSINAYLEARNMLRQCLELNVHYTPAKNLLEKIELKLKN